MADKVQFRRDTAARWASVNPVLLDGEVGYVTDSQNKYKLGDGVHHWNDLPLQGFNGTVADGVGTQEDAVMSQKATTDLVTEYNVSDHHLNTYAPQESDRYNTNVFTLEEAIQAVPASLRRGGIKLTFISTDNEWVNYVLQNDSWTLSLIKWIKVENNFPAENESGFAKGSGIKYNEKVLEKELNENSIYSKTNETIIHENNIQSFTGIFSRGYCYALKNHIPAGYTITELQVNKTDLEGNGVGYSDFVLIDKQTLEIKQKFACNLTIQNENGLYTQFAPINHYNETDCYLGILVKSNDKFSAASSYPSTFYNKALVFNYDPDTEELSGGSDLGYDIAIYLKVAQIKTLKQKFNEYSTQTSQEIQNINNELILDETSEISVGELHQYSGLSSKAWAYCPQELIIPAGCILTELKVTKYTWSGEGVNCFFGLVDVSTNEIKQKFQASNFETPEQDGSYKQNIPQNLYNETDCYLVELLPSNAKYGVATSYETVVIDAAFSWAYDEQNDTLSNKTVMSYGVDMKMKYRTPAQTVKEAVQELLGESEETIQEMLSKSDKVILAPKDYYIENPIVLTSGKSLYGVFGKTRLILSNGCTNAINIMNAEKVIVDGISIVGTLPNYNYEMNGIVPGDNYYTITSPSEVYCTYPGETKGGSVRSTQHITGIGNEIGIYAYYSEYVILQNIEFNNIDGSALKMNHVGQSYIKCANINNLFINNCFNGIWTENEHEFSMYNNVKISLCQVGMLIASGNLIFNNFAVTRCRLGVCLSDGYNHGHGIINTFEIKHCQVYGLCIQDVNYGECFGELFMQYAGIYIKDSKGICIGKLTGDTNNITCVNDIGYTKKNSIITVCGNTFTPTGNLEVKQFVDFM